MNPRLLNTYLWTYYGGNVEEVNERSMLLRTKIFNLNKYIGGLDHNDTPIYFCYKMISLLNKIEGLNAKELHSVGLRVNFIVFEELQLKYQKLKYRYNHIYHIKSKNFDKIDSFRLKLKEFQSLRNKFTYQFALFLTPTIGRVLPLKSETEDNSHKQLL